MRAQLFPDLVRQARQALGHDLLTVARGAGCSESYISLIESEKRLPSEELALRIAQTLRIDETEALLALLRSRLPEASRAALAPSALVRDPAFRFSVVRDFVGQQFAARVEHVKCRVDIDWSGDATITRAYEGFQPIPGAEPVKEIVVRDLLPGSPAGAGSDGLAKPRVLDAPQGLHFEFHGEVRGGESVHSFAFPEGWTWAASEYLSFETRVSVRQAYAMDLQSALAARKDKDGPVRNRPLHAAFRRFNPLLVDRLTLEVRLPRGYRPADVSALAWLGDAPLDDVADGLADRQACLSYELAADGADAKLTVIEPLPFYSFAVAWLPMERAARVNARTRATR